MIVNLNGNKHYFAAAPTVQELLTSGLAEYSVMAVVLNGNVVRDSDYPQIFLSDGDSVELIPFISGG